MLIPSPAMVNYAIVLLLASLLSLSMAASLLAVILRAAASRVRRELPHSPSAHRPGDNDSSVIPYARPEAHRPLLTQHPWLAAVFCGAIASAPVAGMLHLTWWYLPAPTHPIAIASTLFYLVLLVVLMVRGCSGFDRPAAARWNQRTLLLSLIASMLIGVTAIWVVDIRVKGEIAAQKRHVQDYLAERRSAQPTDGPAAADFCAEAATLCTALPPRPHWSSSLPLVAFPPEAEPIHALVRKAAQCKRWGNQSPGPNVSLYSLHAHHAAWQAHQGNWNEAIQDLNDLYALTHLQQSGAETLAWVGVELAEDLTRTLIAEARTPRHLASIPLPGHEWCQKLVEEYADAMAIDLLCPPGDPQYIPELAEGTWWRSLLYRVVCYDDELRTAQENARQIAQISRACASPGPFAANFPMPPAASPLSAYSRRIASARLAGLSAALNIRVQRDLLELAITCRRFEMSRGRMPRSLQELVDNGLIDDVPTDLWDGAPLRVRFSNGSLDLISVNQDIAGNDDISVTVTGRSLPQDPPPPRPAR